MPMVLLAMRFFDARRLSEGRARSFHGVCGVSATLGDAERREQELT
jgi:hypothetical protein